MTQLLFRVAMASAAVSVVMLPLLLASRWQKRYAPHTRRAVWLVIAAVLLAAPLLPKARAPVQITVPERAVAVQTAPKQAAQYGTVSTASARAEASGEGASVAESELTETHAVRTVAWTGVLAALWLAGAAAILLWQAAVYLPARRRLLNEAVPLAGYEELAKELCPGRTVRFFRVSGLDTPMTMGVLRPVVLLTDGDVYPAAVRHELVHIRRWDVAWKHLLLLACAVHWFNPLVWLMSRRAERDMEASCDAAVLADGDAAERRAYGELLIRTAAGRGIPFTTRFSGGKKLMKARLYDLFHPGKRSRGLVGAVLLLCLAAGSLVAFQSAVPMTAEEAVRALEESISYESGSLSFTIPADYSPKGDWSIHIAGRAETDELSGISLHYLDGEQWVAGKTYTLDIAEEQWPNITELSMEVSLGGESRTVDLLAMAGLDLATPELDGDQTEYMLQEDGLVYILQAGSAAWEPWSGPVPAPASWAGQDLAGRDQAETLADCEQYWIGMTSAENGWLVASVGAGVAHADTYVYRTCDGGRTWQETGRPEEALWYPSCVAFLDDDRAIMGIGRLNGAPVYMTEDGGETWSELELPLPDDGLTYEVGGIVFYGACGVITLHRENGYTAVITDDYGKTWRQSSARLAIEEDGSPAYLPFAPELLPTEQFDDRLHDNDPIRLLGELPEEGIRLYGLTWASVGIGGTLLTVERDGEPVILHYDVEIAPRSMEVYDYDRDGIEELVVEAASADGEAAVFLFVLEGADFGQMRQVR